MHESGKNCIDLLVATANALSEKAVAVMLLAVQRRNLEVSITLAVRR